MHSYNFLAVLQNPGTIFYWPYLVSAFVISLLWMLVMERQTFLALIKKRGVRWLSHSGKADLMLTVGYLTLLRMPIAAIESAAFAATLKLTKGGVTTALGGWSLTAPSAVEAIGATAVTMLAIDFTSYFVHRVMHAVPLLWKIHALHHSAEELTPLTTYRQHPLEPFLLYGGRGAAAGMALGIFHGIFLQATPVITISGLGAGFFVYMFTVNLHHSPVAVAYPKWLKSFAMSPHLHHIHHSAALRHHRRNYGVVFSCWDRLFQTYLDEPVKTGELKFGLGQKTTVQSIFGHLLGPVAYFFEKRAGLVAETAKKLGPLSLSESNEASHH